MNCANCGQALTERGCKVRCPRCGYFEDCSDPSAPGEWESRPPAARDDAPAAGDPDDPVR